jgi:hypothetical protein
MSLIKARMEMWKMLGLAFGFSPGPSVIELNANAVAVLRLII